MSIRKFRNTLIKNEKPLVVLWGTLSDDNCRVWTVFPSLNLFYIFIRGIHRQKYLALTSQRKWSYSWAANQGNPDVLRSVPVHSYRTSTCVRLFYCIRLDIRKKRSKVFFLLGGIPITDACRRLPCSSSRSDHRIRRSTHTEISWFFDHYMSAQLENCEPKNSC